MGPPQLKMQMFHMTHQSELTWFSHSTWKTGLLVEQPRVRTRPSKHGQVKRTMITLMVMHGGVRVKVL